MKVMETRPDNGYAFRLVSSFGISTDIDTDGWLYWDVTDVLSPGEEFLLNFFNGDSIATATNWGTISGSSLYNFTDSNANGVRDGSEPDALTPVVNPTAQTVVKGPMR